MTAVVFHFELPKAWHNPFAAKKAFIRWSHTCKAFGVRNMVMIDVDGLGYEFGDDEIDLRVVKNLTEALGQFDGTPVYVEEGGAPLHQFAWPEDPLFIYGSDFGQLPRADLSLETATPLNAEIANGAVLAYWRAF